MNRMKMKTEILPAEGEAIAKAADLLRRGELVALPTETVYGIAADARNGAAVAKIFVAKGRPQDNPLILHIPDASWLTRYCEDVPDAAYKLAESFWPGPLTMILKKKPCVPLRTTGGLETVGMRCPDHAVTRAIIEASGVPVAAPSANTSGRPSCTTAEHVREDMWGKIDGIVDGGPCQVGVESTIIDLTVTPPQLLRPGGLPLESLRDALGDDEHGRIGNPGDVLANLSVGRHIDRAGGVIKNEHARMLEQRARDAQALLLTARKRIGALVELVLDLVPENDLFQAFDYGFFDVSVILNAVYA